MSNIVVFGFPNHSAEAYTVAQTVIATYDPPLMGPELLKTDEPSERARKSTLDPYYTMWGFDTSLVPLTIDGLALVNHNIADGGQVRFVGWGGAVAGTLNLPTRVVATSIVASTNLTGTIANIDETIDAPDGVFMGPSNAALSWSVTLKFPSLSGTINTGADMMALVVRARRVFTGAGATNPLALPKFTASLAAPAFPLSFRAVTVSATGGQVFIFPFKRSDFTSTSDFQATFESVPGHSFSGGQHAVLEVAAVYYDAVTLNSPTHDSGWLTWQTDSRLARTAPSQHVHYFPPTPWENIIGYSVQVRTDQAIHSPLVATGGKIPVGVIPSDPVNYVQAGVFPAGPAIRPAVGVRKGGAGPMAGGPEIVGFAGATAGGQAYGADAYGFREIPPLELIVTRDELTLLQDQLGFRKGQSLPFYLAVEPGVAQKYQMFTAFWATLKSLGKPRALPGDRYKADGTMRFLVEASFIERL